VKPKTNPLAKKEALPKPKPKEKPAPPAESKPEPAPQPEKPEPVKLPEPEKEKPKQKEKPKEKEKPEPPEPKKVDKKPKKRKKPENKDSLDSILKNLKEKARKSEQEEKPKEDGGSTSDSQQYDATKPLSLSQRDRIIQEIQQKWNFPAGIKDDYTLKVRLIATFRPDGSLIQVKLDPSQRSRFARESNFRAAAEAAERAIRKASPLESAPRDNYASWKEMAITFDPRDALY
jgi:hypothetical protein